jgi:hypothetical protein
LERSAAIERFEPLNLERGTFERFEQLERSAAIERFKRLERLELLERLERFERPEGRPKIVTSSVIFVL